MTDSNESGGDLNACTECGHSEKCRCQGCRNRRIAKNFGDDTSSQKLQVTGYELTGVTDESREAILSYEPDDAGNIDMRIAEAEPLHSNEQVRMWLREKVESIKSQIAAQEDAMFTDADPSLRAQKHLLEDLIKEVQQHQ